MYRKNVAGQFVCFQMLLTATGAVATGLSPAVRRCIDGTFAGGGGTVTEDGTTGSYKYAMTQADTNGNDISFIFSAATAMPVCLNIVTTAGDPTDSVRFGLTGLANAVPGQAGGLFIAGTNAATTVTTALTTTFTGNLTGNVGGSVASLTTNNDKTGYALTSGERDSISDNLLDRDMSTGADSGSTTVRTVRQALRFLRNKWAISGTTLTVYKEDDATSSWSSTVTATASADPITANDPAGP